MEDEKAPVAAGGGESILDFGFAAVVDSDEHEVARGQAVGGGDLSQVVGICRCGGRAGGPDTVWLAWSVGGGGGGDLEI